METSVKPEAGKTTLGVLSGLVVFWAVLLVIGIILNVILEFAGQIPILGGLLKILLLHDSSSTEYSMGIGLIASFFATCAVVGKVTKHKPSEALACEIIGYLTAVIYGLSAISNFLNNGPIFTMIMGLAAGIALVVYSKKVKDK